MNWSEHEQGALVNFLAAPSPLKDALEKFTADLSRQQKALCTTCMASVPRDPERAADYAAKAQMLDEFWLVLADQLMSLQEPTLEESKE